MSDQHADYQLAQAHGETHPETATGHGETGHPAEGHAAAHGEHAAPAKYLLPLEVPNLVTLSEAYFNEHFTAHEGHRPHPRSNFMFDGAPPWLNLAINPLFGILYAVVIVLVLRAGIRRRSVRAPGRLQTFSEVVLGGLYKFFYDVLGESGKQYIPFAGSLFLFIFVNNIMCLVPLFKAPTSSLATTLGLGILTFAYVHFNVIRQAGFKAWFLHLVGEPLWLAPLMFPLHVMGELIKPISLSARLFGNILGEDKLLAAFLGIGMMIAAAIGGTSTPWVGVPLHLPFYFLVVLGSTIQALVFSLLASIYIVLLLPHGDHAHEDHKHFESEHDEHHGPGARIAAAGSGH